MRFCVRRSTWHVQVWLVEDGTVERYDGDFDDYKTDLIKEIAAEMDQDEEEERASRPTATA